MHFQLNDIFNLRQVYWGVKEHLYIEGETPEEARSRLSCAEPWFTATVTHLRATQLLSFGSFFSLQVPPLFQLPLNFPAGFKS